MSLEHFRKALLNLRNRLIPTWHCSNPFALWEGRLYHKMQIVLLSMNRTDLVCNLALRHCSKPLKKTPYTKTNKPAKTSGIFSLPRSATGTIVACILEDDESSKDIKHPWTCSPLIVIISYFQSKKNKEDRLVRKSKAEVILKRQAMPLP